LSNIPIRKNHGSISSTDSGHSEAMSYCEGNVYQLTSSILHNGPSMTAPLPPRRHSAVQQGSNTSNLYHPMNNSGTVGNGEMPPPPNPRTRPFPTMPAAPNANVSANVAGYNLYTTQQHFNQMRHTGTMIHPKLFLHLFTIIQILGMIPSPPPRNSNRYHPQNLAEMARLHRIGRAYSHEGVIDSSLGDVEIYYPVEDGKL
jgi:hypothetical protein